MTKSAQAVADTATTTSEIRTDSCRDGVVEISGALRLLLADVFSLYLKTKNFHWHMNGRHFRDYHLLLDEHSDQIFAMTDDIAERARKIVGATLHSISDIARHQRLKDNNDEGIAPKEMLLELRADNGPRNSASTVNCKQRKPPMTFNKTDRAACLFAGLFLLATQAELPAQSSPDLSRQIAEVMSQGPSGKAHQRFAHAKGIVCEGTFQAATEAADISRAAHLHGASVPVTVRFSDGAPDITVADNSPNAAPRGMAIRFESGRGTDIVALSHNGFVVGTGEDFLALQKALAATDSSKPHPWPIEAFLGIHPKALKFVQDPKPVPVSFVTESFFGNNAFLFVNSKGEKRAGRYQIVPVSGAEYLDDAAAKAKSPDFLSEELRPRLAKTSAKFRLLLQLAEQGDQTNDASMVWPDDRKKIELGIMTIASVVPDSAAAERKLAFDPTRLIDGIELSDDPLPALRSRVYAYSVAGRLGH